MARVGKALEGELQILRGFRGIAEDLRGNGCVDSYEAAGLELAHSRLWKRGVYLGHLERMVAASK